LSFPAWDQSESLAADYPFYPNFPFDSIIIE
jgi:hypothetical protein